MAQYDILLNQNVHATLVDYEQKFINIAKGGIVSAIADQTPTVLSAGTNGYVLARDDAEATGLKWIDPASFFSLTFGSEGQIPRMNAAGDDFFYTPDMVYDGTKLILSNGKYLDQYGYALRIGADRQFLYQ